MDHDSKLQEFLGMKGQRRILADLELREAKKRQQVKEAMEIQLQQYRTTLEQIQEFCGESDIERLAVKFVKQEEENFALFNYINELNHESESLSYAIDSLKKNIGRTNIIKKLLLFFFPDNFDCRCTTRIK